MLDITIYHNQGKRNTIKKIIDCDSPHSQLGNNGMSLLNDIMKNEKLCKGYTWGALDPHRSLIGFGLRLDLSISIYSSGHDCG